jgi:hypothetical protein
MSQPATPQPWSWQPWAWAFGLLVVSASVPLADLAGLIDTNSPLWSFVRIASDAAFLACLIWIMVLMKPRLWPPKK